MIVTAENGVVAEIVSIILTQFCVGVSVLVGVDVTEGVIPLTEEDRVGVLVKVTVEVGVTPVIEIVPVGVGVFVDVGVGVRALNTLKDKVKVEPLVNDVVPESTIVRPVGLLTPSITKLFVVLSALKTVESDVL